MSFIITIIISVLIALAFIKRQYYYFSETRKYRILFVDFFKKKRVYSTYAIVVGEDPIPQITNVGKTNSDLSKLIGEINHYIEKTKGTSDFSMIQNKVERKLNMRYDQSTAKLSFPTYIGLMGTFLGVGFGILTFICGFDGVGNISDDSIRNLLIGVMISMVTSLSGLGMTTISNEKCGEARKKIEEDKNEFYDFIQTELMPTIDVSMVAAITKLHTTVDKFEPAFNNVINRFQETFDRCTKAFGEDFEKHVRAISGAVSVMGENIDKINKNIRLQEGLISTLKSEEISKGMDKYIEASNQFGLVTNAIYRFEEMRSLMLTAVQETINLQDRYNESLNVPREIAVEVNKILDRISTFEKSINETGKSLNNSDLLGGKMLKQIDQQITAISKKNDIACKYFEIADGKLEDLFTEQTKVLQQMNDRYKNAIESHIVAFENMLKTQTAQIEAQHREFVEALKEKFDVKEVHKEFTNLKKLESIEGKISEIIGKVVQPNNVEDVKNEIKTVENQLLLLKSELEAINTNIRKTKETKGIGKILGLGR